MILTTHNVRSYPSLHQLNIPRSFSVSVLPEKNTLTSFIDKTELFINGVIIEKNKSKEN